jgi:hypothetical protein
MDCHPELVSGSESNDLRVSFLEILNQVQNDNIKR